MDIIPLTCILLCMLVTTHHIWCSLLFLILLLVKQIKQLTPLIYLMALFHPNTKSLFNNSKLLLVHTMRHNLTVKMLVYHLIITTNLYMMAYKQVVSNLMTVLSKARRNPQYRISFLIPLSLHNTLHRTNNNCNNCSNNFTNNNFNTANSNNKEYNTFKPTPRPKLKHKHKPNITLRLKHKPNTTLMLKFKHNTKHNNSLHNSNFLHNNTLQHQLNHNMYTNNHKHNHNHHNPKHPHNKHKHLNQHIHNTLKAWHRCSTLLTTPTPSPSLVTFLFLSLVISSNKLVLMVFKKTTSGYSLFLIQIVPLLTISV